MVKIFDAEEVAKHNTAESCWVILYGEVWDVTEFLPEHPGGSKIILQLAGKDATEEFDPVHPEGTLIENMKPEAKLGQVDMESLKRLEAKTQKGAQKSGGGKDGKEPPPPLESLMNLDEIEDAATKQVSRKCYAYYFSAGDDLLSKYYNNTVYRNILLRPRVFVDCTRADQSTTVFGHRVGTPVFVAPAAMARLAHPDGEAGIARGISSFGGMQVVSHNASMTPEQIVADAAEGQVFGWQIYVQNDRRKSEAMLARINKMRRSYKFVVLTLDAPVPGKRELDEKSQFEGQLQVSAPSQGGDARPGGGGIGQQMFWGTASDLTWHTTLPWLRKHTDLPIVLKGVQTHEDAYLAARYAEQNPGSVAGIILSNHGGRALDTAPPAVHTLLEIRKYCPEVLDKIDVWVDGGIRRGTDVVKALCLGAKAVGVGRAALWGLGAGGWKGVHRTFEILTAEIDTCLKLLGVQNLSELGPRFINTRMVERDIYDGDAGLDKPSLWTKAKI
ncbi:uncharacterized protein E0L32_004333 [Thyridium curvatum]|uniref:L-lactate dehydrogenase (cytochrome) n=1 Tax=Thyridium curvatum TaxID=1093900 RepID=A0A507AXX5_9PEZI|nr:uncharacterized protein E0L32_004333 [Thyridium curvatum]TPX15635.1 hypothetical protein E0L32_004333 [Thyridium curvatum]